MHDEDLIVQLLQENRIDIKKILELIPTFQTIQSCDNHCNNTEKEKRGSRRFSAGIVIAILTGLSGLIIGIVSIIKP